MPELPEVETIRRRLTEVIIGQRIVGIEVIKSKSLVGLTESVIGKKITGVDRGAKILSINTDGEYSILVHLKMTGQIIVMSGDKRVGGGHPTADWVQTLPSAHTRVIIRFEDPDTTLFFNDQRVFGWMKIVDAAQKKQEFAKYGPDINTEAANSEYFWQGLQRTSRPIKVRLMDGTFIAGVGNIYACDALNLAKLSPYLPSKELTRKQSDLLLKTSKKVIQRGIELHGTTFDGKYVSVDGFAGGYQEEILAYGRAGQPCKNCNTSIIKTTLAGRGTYYCPDCQKL